MDFVNHHQPSDTAASDIIWAFGPKSRYAHAYPGRNALEAGVPLCGIQCAPNQIVDGFDPSGEPARGAACPHCLERLVFARYMRPARAAAHYGAVRR